MERIHLQESRQSQELITESVILKQKTYDSKQAGGCQRQPPALLDIYFILLFLLFFIIVKTIAIAIAIAIAITAV